MFIDLYPVHTWEQHLKVKCCSRIQVGMSHRGAPLAIDCFHRTWQTNVCSSKADSLPLQLLLFIDGIMYWIQSIGKGMYEIKFMNYSASETCCYVSTSFKFVSWPAPELGLGLGLRRWNTPSGLDRPDDTCRSMLHWILCDTGLLYVHQWYVETSGWGSFRDRDFLRCKWLARGVLDLSIVWK